MAVNLEDVVQLANELDNDQKAKLVVWLLDNLKAHQLTPRERLAVFDSMTVDLGAVLPGYSDRRDDWYEDAR